MVNIKEGISEEIKQDINGSTSNKRNEKKSKTMQKKDETNRKADVLERLPVAAAMTAEPSL